MEKNEKKKRILRDVRDETETTFMSDGWKLGVSIIDPTRSDMTRK
jgi:hypothetical protein